jgi:hypothetical protein
MRVREYQDDVVAEFERKVAAGIRRIIIVAPMLRRLRLGNLRKLFRHRYGPTLPDDDVGRADLRELLLPISVSANADIKMPNAIEVWAPWMGQDEAEQLINDINRTPRRQRMLTARQLGNQLCVTNAERERLKLWTIAPYNMTDEQMKQYRQAKDIARKRRLRQLRAEYEANSANRTKPWLAAGISRATWYRQRETSASGELKCETGPSEVRLLSTADAPVSPEQAPPPKKRRAVQLATGLQPNTPTKAQKPKPQRPASGDATATPDQRTHLSQVEPDTSSGRTAELSAKAEQDLIEMVVVLRTFLRQATSTDWRKHMEIHGKWSKTLFDRRLRILKQREWVRVAGDAKGVVDRVPEGVLYEVTEKAPGAPVTPVFNQHRDAIDVGKAAREQLERLKRGTPSAA